MLSLTKIGFLLVAYQVAFIQCNSCPDVKPVENANVDKVASGTWYDVAVSRNDYPNGETFSTLNYAHIGDVISFSTVNLLPSDPDYVNGVGRMVSPGKMIFSFEIGDSKQDADMTVVGLDDDFLALFGCIEGGKSQGITWVSARQENPDEKVKAKINKFLDSYVDPNTKQKASWKSRI